MSRWGELIPHDDDNESCLCGCLDEEPAETGFDDSATWAPPVDEYRLSTRPAVVGGGS